MKPRSSKLSGSGRENHEAVNSVITRLVDETASYHMGIMIGVQIADEGLMFAKEAGEFYERLAQVDGVPQAESLDENLSHMCHLVGKAHCGPLTVNKRFRNVRTNMFEVCTQGHLHGFDQLIIEKADYEGDTNLR